MVAEPHVEMSDLMRGVAGGVLLGVPFLYTQEVWLHGARMHAGVILALLAVTFVTTAALSKYVGFERDRKRLGVVEEAVVAVGISVMLSTLLLMLLGRIGPGMPVHSIAGTVTLTMVPISIGFSIGNALAPKEGAAGASKMRGPWSDLLIAAAGTIVFVLNISPTEEPILLAGQLSLVQLLLVIGASLVLSYLIVFYAEFGGKGDRLASDGATQGPITETLLAYLVSWIVCALLLLAFGRLESATGANVASIIVLAFPGSLGGALGRMLV